jgi:hypothetical protein
VQLYKLSCTFFSADPNKYVEKVISDLTTASGSGAGAVFSHVEEESIHGDMVHA